jgi:hypothetical protein
VKLQEEFVKEYLAAHLEATPVPKQEKQVGLPVIWILKKYQEQ